MQGAERRNAAAQQRSRHRGREKQDARSANDNGRLLFAPFKKGNLSSPSEGTQKYLVFKTTSTRRKSEETQMRRKGRTAGHYREEEAKGKNSLGNIPEGEIRANTSPGKLGSERGRMGKRGKGREDVSSRGRKMGKGVRGILHRRGRRAEEAEPSGNEENRRA